MISSYVNARPRTQKEKNSEAAQKLVSATPFCHDDDDIIDDNVISGLGQNC